MPVPPHCQLDITSRTHAPSICATSLSCRWHAGVGSWRLCCAADAEGRSTTSQTCQCPQRAGMTMWLPTAACLPTAALMRPGISLTMATPHSPPTYPQMSPLTAMAARPLAPCICQRPKICGAELARWGLSQLCLLNMRLTCIVHLWSPLYTPVIK